MKKISIAAKPTQRRSADQWINDAVASEPTKRLTIDITARLHARIKSQCAMRGVNMTDELRKLLEDHFPEEYDQGERGVQPAGNTTL